MRSKSEWPTIPRFAVSVWSEILMLAAALVGCVGHALAHEFSPALWAGIAGGWVALYVLQSYAYACQKALLALYREDLDRIEAAQ